MRTCTDIGLRDEAIKYGLWAQDISKKMLEDRYLYFKPLWGLAYTYYNQGYGKKCLHIGKKLLDFGCEMITNFVKMYLGIVSIYKGNMSKGIKMIEELKQVSNEIERIRWLALFESTLGSV